MLEYIAKLLDIDVGPLKLGLTARNFIAGSSKSIIPLKVPEVSNLKLAIIAN